DRRGAVGEHGDAIALAREQVARVHAERARGVVAAAREVRDDFLDAAVVAGDRVAARDVPLDRGVQQRAERRVVAARVEVALGRVQAGEQRDRGGALHGAYAITSVPIHAISATRATTAQSTASMRPGRSTARTGPRSPINSAWRSTSRATPAPDAGT